MKLSEETISAQHALADYCRTGKQPVIPGARPERLHHYRRLVKNVLNNTLVQAFPITFKLLKPEQWENLIHDFFTIHNAQTPQVWKLPLEFYTFLKENNYAQKLGRPYLNDLLYFEWIEIEVHTMPDENIPTYKEAGDFFHERVLFTPEFRIIQLEYPVHLMAAEKSADKKGNFFLLVFRHKDSGNVNFLNLSILFVYLIEHIHYEKKSLQTIFPDLQKLFGITNAEEAKHNIQQFLKMLQKQGFMLGFA